MERCRSTITHRESEVAMKRQGIWIGVLLMGASIVWIAYAQQNRRQNRTMPRYDTSTEITAKGVVESVDSHTGRMGWNGTHLVVKFDAETLPVHVGPSAYVEQKGFSFAQGDQIEVTGSKIKFEGNDVIVAREIKKGDMVLTLRNKQGIPAWSRGRWNY